MHNVLCLHQCSFPSRFVTMHIGSLVGIKAALKPLSHCLHCLHGQMTVWQLESRVRPHRALVEPRRLGANERVVTIHIHFISVVFAHG